MGSIGTSGDTSSGVLHVRNELSDFRTYEVPTAKIVKKYTGRVPFMSALWHEKMPKRPVSDTIFVSFEEAEEPVELPITACSAADGGDSLDLTMASEYARQLNEGSILLNTNMQTTVGGGSGYQHYSSSQYASVTRPELAMVTSLTIGGTTATVRVARMHTVYGTTHTSATNKSTQLWASGDSIIRMSQRRYDSQGYGVPYNKLPERHYNYLFDFTKNFGASELERNVELFVRKDVMKDRMESAFWAFTGEIERTLLYGSYGLDGSMASRESTMPRSLEEIVPAGNRLTMSALTIKALNDILGEASNKGDSTDNRLLVCHPTALSSLANLLTNHITSEGLYGDKEAGWTMPTYMDHTGTKYQLMVSYQMGKAPWLRNTFYVVNMSHCRWAYLKGKEKSFDVHLEEMPPNGSGDKIMRYRAIAGLDIGYWDAHFKVYINA